MFTPSPELAEILERERAIERQNAETFKTHNRITALLCVAWAALVFGFLILGPDFMGIRAAFARAGTLEDVFFAFMAVIAYLAPTLWAPVALFVGSRRRWPPVTPRAALIAQGKKEG